VFQVHEQPPLIHLEEDHVNCVLSGCKKDIFSHVNHKELKFEGDTGILQRRNVKRKQLIHIAKRQRIVISKFF